MCQLHKLTSSHQSRELHSMRTSAGLLNQDLPHLIGVPGHPTLIPDLGLPNRTGIPKMCAIPVRSGTGIVWHQCKHFSVLDITYHQLLVCAICVQETFITFKNHNQVCPSSGGYFCALQSTAQRERQRVQIAVRQPMLRQKHSTKLGHFVQKEKEVFTKNGITYLDQPVFLRCGKHNL